MPVDLHNVQAFYWSATLGSTAHAARALNLTAQAITHRIRKLEQTELNVSLFEREPGRRLKLSAAGVMFLPEAERLLTEWNALVGQIAGHASSLDTLRIGAMESVLHTWLIAWLERCRSERPTLKLELSIDTSEALIQSLRLGALDFVLAARPSGGAHVHSRELPAIPLYFVGKQGVHRGRSYSLEQLARGDLLTFQRASQPQQDLARMLREAGLSTARVHTISSISAMAQLVANGFGVATLPARSGQPPGGREGLRLLAATCQLPPLPVYASYRGDSASTVLEGLVQDAADFADAQD